MKITAIIPARYNSSRFPGKPLIDLCGKTMIQRVYEQVKQSCKVNKVLVATDDERIYKEVKRFDGNVLLTSKDHSTGTDRLAEVAANLEDEIIVNVQGDEPLILATTIDAAIEPLINDPKIEMSTTCESITSKTDIQNPNVVKVVRDHDNFALYFSRLPIPFRNLQDLDSENYPSRIWFKHTGLYVYRRKFLLRLAALPCSPLEKLESLEQLRALYYGHKIKVVEVKESSPGVDTLEDAEHVRQILQSNFSS